ncbi:LysM peptidoglycan-binding domain-containing protein [Pontibacter akesuensis]|uniref:LysM domain-containing protein n=1 Tax=Pontibacter akesuensis TaxID=388950 RepID=A0A1I7J9A7_9BACT|nr:LysM domain-containing protein [Pontibacter akesuensis]GHA71650.1 hypothetical protein GCM10007389_26570 [Pontibacter akesuensis]SFU81722.1 LysM domain-containing protein [Pontibacter akesuensis]
MKFVVKYTLTSLSLFLVFALTQAEASPAKAPASIKYQAIALQGDSTYLVQQGDTYYSLSRRFNVPLDSLQRWNKNLLQIGQTLYLANPKKKSAVAAAKPAAAASKPAVAAKAVPAAKSNTAERGGATTAKQQVESNSAAPAPAPKLAADKTKSRILVIPFDPHLYFSDADAEIARQSKIPMQNVRHVFRGRLNAMLAPEGYETIHLLGGVYRDSVSELSRVYKSLHYAYQDNKQSRFNHQPEVKEDKGPSVLNWVKDQKDRIGSRGEPSTVPVAQDPDKHFGATVKDPKFFSYFNNQYGIDYYVFINQFEVKTIYENCLDRAALNYERDFMVHYSIYDNTGKLVSGNKVKVPYQSNINNVERIVSDSMPNMADRVLSDLPNTK